MSGSVVVTRPAAQAAELLARLAALGRDAVSFPLLEIQALADKGPLRAALADLSTHVSDYAFVAFVSPNAIDAVFAELPAWPAGLPVAVMGEGSRRALAAHGVTDADTTIHSPRGPRTDSETLLEALDLAALRGRKVMILRGESGRELLADRLRDAGVDVAQVAAYRRSAPVLDQAGKTRLKALLEGKNDWIVTSSEALRNLEQMVAQLPMADAVAKMQQQRLFVPHARIAETARAAGFPEVHMSASGDEALLGALQSCL
ncbi:MAG TPA: uroporphyrinogen-III synthase [Burkholderiaceae bacterium]